MNQEASSFAIAVEYNSWIKLYNESPFGLKGMEQLLSFRNGLNELIDSIENHHIDLMYGTLGNLPLENLKDLTEEERETRVALISNHLFKLIDITIIKNALTAADGKSISDSRFHELLKKKFSKVEVLNKPCELRTLSGSVDNYTYAELLADNFYVELDRFRAKREARLDIAILDTVVIPDIIVKRYPDHLPPMVSGSDHEVKSAQKLRNHLKEKPHEDFVMHNFGELYKKHGDYKTAFVEQKNHLKEDGWDPEDYNMRDHPDDPENGYDNFRKNYKRWLKKQGGQ